MHRPEPGPSNGKWSGVLPRARRPRPHLRLLLTTAPVLLPVDGLHVAEQQWGRREQGGRVQQQNAAELVAKQFVGDLHP